MAQNFEIIINIDSPVTLRNGELHHFTIDECIDICNNHNCIYIASPHVPDENSSFNHWHLGIHTSSDNTYETIAKWFDLPTNAVNKIRKQFKTTYALYLIHYNQEGKTPVDPDNVIRNFPLDYEKLISNVDGVKRLDFILEQIDNGIIKPYNLQDYVTLREYTKWKKQFDSAFEFRQFRLKDIPRDMECIFITGDSGLGKTTLAKKICKDRGFIYFVSSGSNDVLDGYRGEPAVILDDLRPSCISLSDLLKMLDNHTASTVKSRYRNKWLETKLIVITSTLDIERFFSQVFENNFETKIQLMRRCKLYILMDKDNVFFKLYNKDMRRYDLVSVIKNEFINQFNNIDIVSDSDVDIICNLLGSDSLFKEKLNNGLDISLYDDLQIDMEIDF